MNDMNGTILSSIAILFTFLLSRAMRYHIKMLEKRIEVLEKGKSAEKVSECSHGLPINQPCDGCNYKLIAAMQEKK